MALRRGRKEEQGGRSQGNATILGHVLFNTVVQFSVVTTRQPRTQVLGRSLGTRLTTTGIIYRPGYSLISVCTELSGNRILSKKQHACRPKSPASEGLPCVASIKTCMMKTRTGEMVYTGGNPVVLR